MKWLSAIVWAILLSLELTALGFILLRLEEIDAKELPVCDVSALVAERRVLEIELLERDRYIDVLERNYGYGNKELMRLQTWRRAQSTRLLPP